MHEIMKARIQDILDTRNIKVVSVWVKKDNELYTYLRDRYGDEATVGEMVALCLNDMDSQICKNGKKKRLIKITEGFGYCGRGKTCQCFMDDVSEKTKAGCDKRTPIAVEYSNAKRKATTQEKYGQDNVSQVETIKTKRGDTMEERHGVRSMFESLEAKEQGMMNKYGVTNPSHDDVINAKRVETNLDKYGGHPAQHHFSPETSKILNDKELLIDFMKDKSHPTIMTELGISQTGLLGYKLRHGIKIAPRSSYENELASIFSTWGINFKANDHIVLRPFAPKPKNTKELDFYFPDHNVAVEFCGIHYHLETILNARKESDADKTFGKKYHLWKQEKCEELGIQLITIFEDEYLDNKEIVLSRLRNVLGLSEKGIYARKTKVIKIDKQVANQFLYENHIQGIGQASIVHYGAYDGNILIGVMSFSHKRPALGSVHIEGHYELLRFATDGRTHTGLASKLFRAFIRDYNPLNVISYADRRWSTGGVYPKMGFDHVSTSRPSYAYVKKGSVVRLFRYSYTKALVVNKMGGDPNKTEWINMQEMGYDRIWDCGTLKFQWKPEETS